MSLTLRVDQPTDVETLFSLASDPSLAHEFDLMQTREAIASGMAGPVRASHAALAGEVDGTLAGFCHTYVLPGRKGDWAMIRMGVLERFRRRGLASAFLETAIDGVRREAPGCREVCLSAWIPTTEATAFAAARGFEHTRYFWLMERPRDERGEAAWPAGIQCRVFDGSDRAYADWNEVYNRSFADHYHSVRTTIVEARVLGGREDFHPDGLLLAYRDGVCVGFCRNELHPGRGEIGTLGVVPEARGIGLGRALLRWGVEWLAKIDAPRITLMVDGENETALSLYRSERFTVARTRENWSRWL